MKTEDELRAAFEQRCIDHLVAQREAGKPLINDNGAPATHESMFWKQSDGSYGVLMFNAAWIGYQWGVEDAAADPNWAHPKIQALLSEKSRRAIEIRLIGQVLEDPNQEFTASDMEYWGPVHDKIRNLIRRSEVRQVRVADAK